MQPETDPNRLLSLARQGDNLAREELIRKFTPFILKIASRLSGRFIRLGEDDEASIGLMAFNEAIDNFNPEKGISFLTLAETIIRRRLVDHFRREKRHRQNIPLSALDQAPGQGGGGMVAGIEDYTLVAELEDRRREVIRYQQDLAHYGITFADLVRGSPRHRDARERALACARVIADNPVFRCHLQEKRELPLKALEKELDTSRKTLERHRKYIIAAAVIMMGQYEYLQEYLGWKRGGEGCGRR
ncbi:MAG: RNA polymerase sigma factor SigI [Thermoanaerobacteraceae bacterium]|nr:RNA polymerase sigma factor SigI [Thermoanaerobacteraceae bacterium]